MMKSSSFRPYSTNAPVTINPSGSPYTYTNTSGRLQCLSVSGGLLVTISLAGISLGLTSSVITVRPGDKVVLTFSTAPLITVTDIM